MRRFPFIRKLAMPLMGKELLEQAARGRTYVLRVVYAALLFVGFAWVFSDKLRAGLGAGPQGVLGRGREMFQSLVLLQFSGVLLFLPAMMSGAITSEKERASLELLFLANLSPWSIICQKYLGRLVPMFAFLLLSLPLMAVSYGFGGISPGYLLSGVGLLVLACLQVGAFALMCSAWCRTNVGALLAAYLGVSLFYLSTPLTLWLLSISYNGGDTNQLESGLVLFPPYVFMQWGDESMTVVILSVLILLTAIAFLAVSRAVLVRRASVPPRHKVVMIFGVLDRLFGKLNRRVGGVLLMSESATIPEDEPVAWRELHKRSLGRVNYLVRLLIAAETLVTLFGILLLRTAAQDWQFYLSFLLVSLWALAALTVIVTAANAIPREYTRQTLDALLTTPLTGSEIVRQKMRPLTRLMVVLAIPLMTVSAMSAFCEPEYRRWFGHLEAGGQWAFSLVSAILSVMIYLPMFAWISLWIGLKVRIKSRAIAIAIAGLAAWCILGPALATALDDGPIGPYLAFLSPGSVIFCGMLGEWTGIPVHTTILTVVLSFGWYGAIMYVVRRACIQHADRYLRNEMGAPR